MLNLSVQLCQYTADVSMAIS